jgi:hypothetical protein
MFSRSFFHCFLFILGFALCFGEPTSEDVARSDSASDSPASEVSQDASKVNVRSDVRTDRVNWEHSPEAMLRVVQYVDRKLKSKYPSQGVKRSKGSQVYVHHKVAFQLVQNITPSELNTPDSPVQSAQYYSSYTQGVIAVFAVKVKIIRTIVGQGGALPQLRTFMSRAGMGASALPTSEENKQEVDERLYLVSIPREPFSRALENPFFNPMSQQIYATAGMNLKQAEVPNKELKSLFPTNRPKMKKITTEQLKALLSGNFKKEDSEDEEEEQEEEE